MTRPPPPKKRADAERNRARVVEAAVAVFAAEGVAASTETIAKRAEVGIATVFRHFPTKADLLVAVLSHHFDELTASAEAALQARDPGAALYDLLHHIVDGAESKKAIADGLGGLAPELHRRKYLGGFRQAMTALIERAQALGAVRDDIGTEEVMAVIVAASRAAEHAGSNASLRRRTVSVIFDGLRPLHRGRR